MPLYLRCQGWQHREDAIIIFSVYKHRQPENQNLLNMFSILKQQIIELKKIVGPEFYFKGLGIMHMNHNNNYSSSDLISWLNSRHYSHPKFKIEKIQSWILSRGHKGFHPPWKTKKNFFWLLYKKCRFSKFCMLFIFNQCVVAI